MIVQCASEMALGALDKSLGGLMAGTWVNSYFFMIELIMCYKYFVRYRSDPTWLKMIVGMTLLIDTVSTIDHYVMIYMYAITHWGDQEFLKRQYWPLPAYLVTTGASAWIVQQFLIFRFWLLSKNKIITPFLMLTSLAAFAGAIVTAVVIIKHPTYAERAEANISVTVWLIASAGSDILIAAILIYTLQRMKTSFRKTQTLIKRLTILAIQTGSPGSVVATIGLIVYLNDNENNISVGIAFSLGRIYALTMLHNLNSRGQIFASTANITGASTTMHLSLGDTFLLQSGHNLNVNDMNGTPQVHVEDVKSRHKEELSSMESGYREAESRDVR
ncbi:hypothetical protein E1B28_013050 [Marasmius oreades]|uniref:DUF6534 domain-containing protein n=1 Tax=Marasmius oreades TaxID=181124 RepID=A0A9P7RNY9_9AGAR|nr:uncharacterized protein E1B28_013050 [Marasmius oreades]KAG7087069.1 hypothetical protein E1B28_013050 [Marasmius oreades]